MRYSSGTDYRDHDLFDKQRHSPEVYLSLDFKESFLLQGAGLIRYTKILIKKMRIQKDFF